MGAKKKMIAIIHDTNTSSLDGGPKVSTCSVNCTIVSFISKPKISLPANETHNLSCIRIASHSTRDAGADTLRGIAVSAVVLIHAFGFSYRFSEFSGISRIFLAVTMCGWLDGWAYPLLRA